MWFCCLPFFIRLTSEIAEYHCQRSPSGKHSVWRRRGRRNLYHHWDPDSKSGEGQLSPDSITGCLNMQRAPQKSIAENRCVVVLQLLGVDGSALKEALTHKKLTAKGEEVTVPSPLCKRFVFVCIVWFQNVMLHMCLFIADDQPTEFWAGNVCPRRLSQGRVWSDLHLVGEEDQPVVGSEGAVTALKKRKTIKCSVDVFYYLTPWCDLICCIGWNLPQQ